MPKLTLAFFNRPRITALLWVALTVFGIVSYTTLLKREGFPSVSIPIVIVNGSYAVNDAAAVDKEVAAPISEIALKQEGVKAVTVQSGPNFFSATARYDENINATEAKKKLQQDLEASGRLPKQAKVSYGAPYFGVTGGAVEQIDATISVYSADKNIPLEELVSQTKEFAEYLNENKPPQVKKFTVAEPFQEIENPMTGQKVTVQKTFDRYGERVAGNNEFYRSVTINVAAVTGHDVIQLDDELRKVISAHPEELQGNALQAEISASYAPSIRDQINELQRTLLEGLLAVLVVGSLIIAFRASIITVLSMVTVIAATLGIIYLLGYSLNVITLFALILGLALIVDDTIIMVEAIDSARRRTKDRAQAIVEATTKISRAMVAATFTAALSFTPLLFVGGVLGKFIRAIPVTIITGLLISLVVALIFIPLFARYLLLGKKQMGEKGVAEPARRIEAGLASLVARPMIWAKHNRFKEVVVGLIAVLIGLSFIGYGVYMFGKVTFNIFPPSKDANQVAVMLTFDEAMTVEKAEEVAAKADQITARTIGGDFKYATYYGMADDQMAMMVAELTPYTSRDRTAPQIVNELKNQFKDFEGASTTIYQVDVGPPTSSFEADITATDRPQAERLARDMAKYLEGLKLKRISGTEATITEATVNNPSFYSRTDNRPIIAVTAKFDGNDTTTLTTLAQAAIRDHYDEEKLAEFGLSKDDITFNLGQESENQDSFKSLAIAFPIVLVAIYILLIIQFRSLLQPLLIFLAIPFSIFGISLGLYYTDNAFSFFSMLGFFALIGLSIKNTILLTDYANQARRAGFDAVDAAVEALKERFRPLVATSLTAVVSLTPLALTSPFWQSLAVTLIFGLLSSTFLVITVFPYFYLGAEFLRIKIPRITFFLWVFANVIVVAALARYYGAVPAVIGFGVLNALWVVIGTIYSVVTAHPKPIVRP
jgi:multidrug efflux pump subunit AcrB